MIRLAFLFLLAALLAGGGCGGGTEKEPGTPDSQDSTLSGLYADLYGDYGEREDVLDDDELTVDEVDCSDPVFTSPEPLPQGGTHPQGLVTPENSYWECEGSIERYHADGTLSGSFTGDYQDVLDFWNICRAGTRPPGVSGVWNVTKVASDAAELLCARLDIMPGIVFCSDLTLTTDRLYTTTGDVLVVHGGEAVEAIEDEDGYEDICYLREE